MSINDINNDDGGRTMNNNSDNNTDNNTKINNKNYNIQKYLIKDIYLARL